VADRPDHPVGRHPGVGTLSMKIGVCGHWLTATASGGKHRYSTHLVSRVSQDHDVYVIMGDHEDARRIDYSVEGRLRTTKALKYLRLGSDLNTYEFDVIHCPGPVVPPYFWVVDAARVITFGGDSLFTDTPLSTRLSRYRDLLTVRYLGSLATIYLMRRRIDAAIVVSAFMRDNIAGAFGLDASTIHTVPHGVSQTTFTPVDSEERRSTLAGLGIQEPYIAHVSGFRPAKNTTNILRGFARADLSTDVSLVFVGAKNHEYTAVQRIIEQEGIENVEFVGYLDDRLRDVYAGAEVLCQPSFRETFGFPILESLACGTPVITSDRIGALEGFDDTQIRVQPDNIGDIAAALERAVPDDDYQRQLVADGQRVLEARTWDRTAAATETVYRSAETDANK
jgi:glycosyltransferase involved in cell wall biosynthesis